MSWDNVYIRYKNDKNRGSSADLKQVTIGLEVDEENLTKDFGQLIKIPNTSNNWANGKVDTKILDLQRYEERVTIDGLLVTGLGTSTSADVDGNGNESYVERNTASEKKADLKEIFLAGGTMWMTYEGSTFSCNMDKLSIRSENKDGYEPLDGEVGFSVKFTVVKGVDL